MSAILSVLAVRVPVKGIVFIVRPIATKIMLVSVCVMPIGQVMIVAYILDHAILAVSIQVDALGRLLQTVSLVSPTLLAMSSETAFVICTGQVGTAPNMPAHVTISVSVATVPKIQTASSVLQTPI